MNQYSEELRQKAAKSNDLNLLHMLESRITEIVQIEKEVRRKFPKLYHQRLPRFMRRRAASHNPKRIPKVRRPKKVEVKDRKKLLAYRRKVRYLKHKRVLDKDNLHSYKDINKSVLHKWFAKRFKLGRDQPGLEYVPLYNNTKNQRNLYRQTLYGCAYLSLGHLVAIKVDNAYCGSTIDSLNKLTISVSGFTFSARALENGRYETLVQLFEPVEKINNNEHQRKAARLDLERGHLCGCYVRSNKSHLILWVPRVCSLKVIDYYRQLDESLKLAVIPACERIRVRLVGPKAREEAMRVAENQTKHREALVDFDNKIVLSHKFDDALGRCIEETAASYTYFQTNPPMVDMSFCGKPGRMLWHKLIKNKAHLVGGKRDVERLLCKQLETGIVLDE